MNVLDALQFLAGPRAILDGDEARTEAFCTEQVRRGDRHGRLIPIYPTQSSAHRWPFRSVFVFLNELPGDWREHRISSGTRAGGNTILKVFSADGAGNGTNRIMIDDDDEWNPHVQISRPDADLDAWTLQPRDEDTMEGTQRRQNCDKHMKNLIWWRMSAVNLRGGNAWLTDRSFVPLDAADFHPVVHHLVRTLIRAGLDERNSRIRFIFALSCSFTTSGRPHLVMSEAEFRAHVPGYLHPDVGQRLPDDGDLEKVGCAGHH
jgi:hypothetical protein